MKSILKKLLVHSARPISIKKCYLFNKMSKFLISVIRDYQSSSKSNLKSDD